jgi:hypothetical protein
MKDIIWMKKKLICSKVKENKINRKRLNNGTIICLSGQSNISCPKIFKDKIFNKVSILMILIKNIYVIIIIFNLVVIMMIIIRLMLCLNFLVGIVLTPVLMTLLRLAAVAFTVVLNLYWSKLVSMFNSLSRIEDNNQSNNLKC